MAPLGDLVDQAAETAAAQLSGLLGGETFRDCSAFPFDAPREKSTRARVKLVHASSPHASTMTSRTSRSSRRSADARRAIARLRAHPSAPAPFSQRRRPPRMSQVVMARRLGDSGAR